jgi:hypothetical protein
MVVKENEIVRAGSRNGGKRIVYRVLVGKPEGNILLGNPGHRWHNIITETYKRHNMPNSTL